MKTIALLFLFAAYQSCFATEDTNVIAAGNWSESVYYRDSGKSGCTIRGRLLLCESPKDQDAAVYLELQECSDSWGGMVEVYCNMNPTEALGGHPDAQGNERIEKEAAHWEMRDGSGKPVPVAPGGFSGGAPGANWIVLPCDSTMRLRTTVYGGGRLKDGSLSIFFLANEWIIPPHSTHDYYLSCTFTADPPTNHITPPNYEIWKGTLKLPAMKIPVKKP
jgi:hypothetical protein